MTFYLPNPKIRPVGVEFEEFLDTVRLEPRDGDTSSAATRSDGASDDPRGAPDDSRGDREPGEAGPGPASPSS
jgi:hypothetical protein